MSAYVYIVTNKKYWTLYVGVTSDLEKRVHEHKSQTHENSFTAKYHCSILVWYNECESIVDAIAYEKKLKWGSRDKKIKHIENMNAERNDLSKNWYSGW
jgi:putative endonuclease